MVEKIGYPQMCVDKSLLNAFYDRVSCFEMTSSYRKLSDGTCCAERIRDLKQQERKRERRRLRKSPFWFALYFFVKVIRVLFLCLKLRE